jgi:glycosyltransferase involved in cell wall biosynthesis
MRNASSGVTILLSVHNGEAYLNAQIDSFLAQDYTNWRLIWRDDGSSDASRSIVRAFAAHRGAGRCLEIDAGTSACLGIAESYRRLLAHVRPGAMVAFSDQDDVWLPDKLQRAVTRLGDVPAGTPALYCARQVLTDNTLKPIGLSPALTPPASCLSALTQNIATGCTVVFNAATLALLMATQPPPSLILHDWWAYLTVSAAGGTICVDNSPSILYRQHGANAIGAAPSRLNRGKAALRRGPTAFMAIFRSSLDWLLAHGTILSPETIDALVIIRDGLRGGPLSRMRLLWRFPHLARAGFAENLLFRLWFVCG